MQKTRYYGLRLGMTFVIILDTFRRIFRDIRPFDELMLILELLVLLLIAYEVGSGIWQRIRRHRRSKRLLKNFSQAQTLQTNFPTTSTPIEDMNDWRERVLAWDETTDALLKKYSPQASAAFLHFPASAINVAWPHIHGNAHREYALLQQRVNNLHDIIEKAEVYL